ncbi:helicase [Streptomyces sp. NPDC047974]
MAVAVAVKLSASVSNAKTWRDKLDQERLDALRKLGLAWA